MTCSSCDSSNHPVSPGTMPSSEKGATACSESRKRRQSTCAGRGFGSLAKREYPSTNCARCDMRSSIAPNTRWSCAVSGCRARRWPDCASDAIGATELLISCAMTRITRFQIATSCALTSRVSCFSRRRRCGCPFNRNCRCETWNTSASSPMVAVKSRSRLSSSASRSEAGIGSSRGASARPSSLRPADSNCRAARLAYRIVPVALVRSNASGEAWITVSSSSSRW